MIIAVSLYHAASVCLLSLPLPPLVAADRIYAQPSKNHLVLFFVLITGKLHALGLLRTLNARRKLRHTLATQDIGRVSLTGWQWEQETISPADQARSSGSDSMVSPVVKPDALLY
jgi:N-acetylated-alpha-linked acidic dipeptidase